MQESSIETTKKPKTLLIAIIVAIISLALGGLIVFLILSPSTSTSKTGNAPASENGEEAITDYEELKEIRTRSNLILVQSDADTRFYKDPLVVHTPGRYYNNLSEIANLDTKRKVALAFIHADNTFFSTDWVDATLPSGTSVKKYPDFDIEPTASTYQSLFGEKMDLSKDVEINYSFVNYLYKPSEKALYLLANGGMDLPSYNYLFYPKYTKQGNKAYTYFVFASCGEDIEKDPNCADGYTGNQINIKEALDGESYITEKNAPNFTYYRLVFEDDGTGNYVYKTAELVENK